MLLFVALAAAETWNLCAAAVATASLNAGWTLLGERDGDGAADKRAGTFSAAANLAHRWSPVRELNACDATDGMHGLSQPGPPVLLEVDALPGEGVCPVRVWADGYSDAGSVATIQNTSMGAEVNGHVMTTADAGNTGIMGVDGGGGAQFTSQWAYAVGGVAAMSGVITVSDQSAYNGASLSVPGWAKVEAYDGKVEAWVRRGAAWVHVEGEAPLEIPFGATVAGHGQVCATGHVSSGAHAEPGGATVGGSGLTFALEPVRTVGPTDKKPVEGPEFESCGC